MIKTVITVKPRGFCAGVVRSINIVKKTLEKYGTPIYVKHAIVHNQTVIKDLEKKGAVFVEEVEKIPPRSIVIFSAHGSPPQHYQTARKRNLRIIDATCPLVLKVHQEMRHFLLADYQVVYVGHRGHVEAEGVLGEARQLNKLSQVFVIKNKEEAVELSRNNNVNKSRSLAILSQTTFNVYRINEIINELEKTFSVIRPDVKDICYATTNRQEAVAALAQKADVVLIVGSQESSNSNRLKEVALENGASAAYIVDNVNEIKESWFKDKEILGLSAAASAPEFRVQEVVDFFVQRGAKLQEMQGAEEKMHFPLPEI